MKTPMQEMIEEMNKILRNEKECFILDLRDKATELMQKEKEIIMVAFSSGEHQQGFEGEAEQYYNETFNAK